MVHTSAIGRMHQLVGPLVAATVVLTGLTFGAATGAAAAGSDPYQSITLSTAPAGRVGIGQSFSLDATWTNQTPFPFTAFDITVTIPAGFRVDGWSPADCTKEQQTDATQILSCHASGAPAGSSAAIHLALTALVETYGATFTASAQTEFSVVSASTRLDIDRPGVVADVHPSPLGAPDPLVVGQPVALSGQVFNGGTSVMNGVIATVNVGAGLRLDGAHWGTGTACAVSGSRATCALGARPGHSGVAVTVAVTPIAVTGTSTTTFTVSTTSVEQQPDPVPDSVTLVRSIVAAVSDVGVDVAFPFAAGEPVVGAQFGGLATVTNHGPAVATGVILTVSGSASLTGLTTWCGHAVCDLGALQPGQSIPIGVFATPTATVPTSITVSVVHAGSEPSPNPTPNTATAMIPTAAPASADLSFLRWRTTSPVAAGTPTTVELQFQALGPSVAVRTTVVVDFPSGWSVQSMTANVGGVSCVFSPASARCAFGDWDEGSTLVLSLVATPGVAGPAQNVRARISSDVPDPDGPVDVSTTIDVVARPTLTIDPAVGAAEGATASVGLRLSVPTAKTVTVNCATGGWTATAGADYAETRRTVTFAPGATTASFDVPTTGDQLDEPDVELVLVACGNAANADLGAPDPALGLAWSGFGILDDDEPPALIPGVVARNEAGGAIDVPVTLSAPSARVVTASWTTVDGDAAAPGDYTATSGSVTFRPGETSKHITVTIRNDSVREPDERCYLLFQPITNARAGGFLGIGVVRILNDD